MNLIRTFVAIKIPVEQTLQDVWADLRNKFDSSQVKWVDHQALHLTLFFLGDTPENDVEVIGKDMSNLLKDQGSFKLEIKGLGYFGSNASPRIIWVGVERSADLIAIKRAATRVMGDYGYMDDQRAFNPHITLGRVKNIKNPQSLIMSMHGYQDFLFQQTEVSGIIHFKSDLKPSGPVYTPLTLIKLQKR